MDIKELTPLQRWYNKKKLLHWSRLCVFVPTDLKPAIRQFKAELLQKYKNKGGK